MTAKKKSSYSLSAEEIKSILADTNHPLHQQLQKDFKKEFAKPNQQKDWNRISDFCEEIRLAEEEADKLMENARKSLKNATYRDIKKIAAVDFMTVLFVIMKADDELSRQAEDFFSKVQSERAKLPRPRSRNPAKEKIKEHWLEWQKDRSLYKNDAEFIRVAIPRSQHVVREATVYGWIREWEKE